jgi:hypothetical protein
MRAATCYSNYNVPGTASPLVIHRFKNTIVTSNEQNFFASHDGFGAEA